MDSSRQTYTPLDELRRIELDARRSNSLDELRLFFDRVQVLRRSHPEDFDLQLFIAEVQDEIIERAKTLREEPASVLLTEYPERLIPDPIRPVSTPKPGEAAIPVDDDRAFSSDPPPGVERLDAKNFQRAIFIGLFFAIVLFSTFIYLIQTARRLNFAPADSAGQTAAQTSATGKGLPTQNASSQAPPVSTKPTLRLYTDLVPGTVSLDDKDPQELKDGELQLDNLEPGRHSIKVIGRTGDAAFSFDIAEKTAPKVVGLPTANNVMAVLVSSQNGKARLVTNAEQSEVLLDGNSAGQVTTDGLILDNLGTTDHDLQVTEGKDRQRFILTFTPAPSLTAYVKADPNAGTVVVIAGQDGADVSVDDKLYKRKTDRGQIRIPNLKVGEYTIGVHKQGFIDPPSQTVQVKKAEETRLEFHLQAVPQIATLQIKSALPGTMVYMDRDLAAAIGADGNATISNVKPGDHTIELRRDQALTKRFQRNFHTGDIIALSGPDVLLDKVVVDNKPAVPPPPVTPPVTPAAPVDNSNMQIEGEQVRKGGGFVAYHVPKKPGDYTFSAQLRKSGGFLKKGRLQWYAGWQDEKNYVVFVLDGKHAIIRQVQDGRPVEINRIPFSTELNGWVQVDLSVKPGSLSARVKTASASGWSDLGSVTSQDRDYTKGNVGFLIPGSDEVAVSNFRFAAHQ